VQYALRQISDENLILIDAAEDAVLTEHGDTIVDGKYPADDAFEMIYGVYMPQPGIDRFEAVTNANESIGYWLGAVRETTCHAIGLEDAVFYAPVQIGHSTRVPFAALVCIGADALAEVRTDSVRALTCFLRFREQMTPATNILNRRGLFAFKSFDKRLSGILTKNNWKECIDEDRVHRTAAKVR
jgi:hypothetical protein